ncbi:hypothetical protein SO802_007218 [Lithocarpus litseifolius]|uniref:DUF7722 domain-containing protein n=1 Tax=Lithocarpus litseifolius TaxID=425828 RepID=A0AAW2DS15_9ROSI
MPLHYSRYKKADYEQMEEWKLDLLLNQYGLSFKGTLDEKRAYAMGAFLSMTLSFSLKYQHLSVQQMVADAVHV